MFIPNMGTQFLTVCDLLTETGHYQEAIRAREWMVKPLAVSGPILNELAIRATRYYGEMMAIERYQGAR